MTTAQVNDPERDGGAAVGIPVDRTVRRLLDDERDDECPRCHGDGMDPWNDYMLPCPTCNGDDL